MRITAWLLAMLLCTSALATPPKHLADDVLVWPTGEAKAGDRIDLAAMAYTLHTSKRCSLPIVNAEQYRELEVHSGTSQYVGCWGATLNKSVVMIAPDGQKTVDSLAIFGRATPNGDGSATLQYPSYSRR
ncbi:hypothetical protein [Burkholderia cenocepacia]|uniref:hypothetical protein n=1 Tax=Burkholderia cenocepacia TaxID=95486 RepID=UPI000F5B6BD6|nr:hypothetical protein [Burkholderia cenocepacia]RQU92472.1 hypothetical protein DF040_12745 [Burkholderia cenocepacia]